MQKSVDYAEGMRLFAHFMKSERTIGIDLFMAWGNAEARARSPPLLHCAQSGAA